MKVKAKHFCLIYDADMINLRLSVSSVCTLCGFFFKNVYLEWISKKNDDFSEKKTSCHGPVLKFEKALQTHSTQFGTSKVSTMNCFCHFKKRSIHERGHP